MKKKMIYASKFDSQSTNYRTIHSQTSLMSNMMCCCCCCCCS